MASLRTSLSDLVLPLVTEKETVAQNAIMQLSSGGSQPDSTAVASLPHGVHGNLPDSKGQQCLFLLYRPQDSRAPQTAEGLSAGGVSCWACPWLAPQLCHDCSCTFHS